MIEKEFKIEIFFRHPNRHITINPK